MAIYKASGMFTEAFNTYYCSGIKIGLHVAAVATCGEYTQYIALLSSPMPGVANGVLTLLLLFLDQKNHVIIFPFLESFVAPPLTDLFLKRRSSLRLALYLT